MTTSVYDRYGMNPEKPEAPGTAGPMDVFQRTNERSAINLVAPRIQAAFIDAQKQAPDLFEMDEGDLFKHLRSNGLAPNATDNRLRLAFWLEYDKVQQQVQKSMQMTNVFGGVCSAHFFYAKYLAVPSRIAWLLCPPVHYLIKMEEALDFGIDRLRDILSKNPDDFKKDSDKNKFMELQTKIILMLDIRVKGAVVQRIEQKSMNLNISTTDTSVARAAVDNSMEKLQRRLKELKTEERKLLNMPVETEEEDASEAAIEVESTTEEST